MVDKISQTTRIKNPQQHAHPDYPRFRVPAEKEKSSDCSLSKHFICSKCCLALLEISCQSNVSLHVCPKSISSFESYIQNSRQRNLILLEVLEHVGLDRILGIRGLSIYSISSFSSTIFEGSSVESMVKGEVKFSVCFCNHTQTLMHPQSTKHSTNIMTPCQQLTCRPQGSSSIMRSITT